MRDLSHTARKTPLEVHVCCKRCRRTKELGGLARHLLEHLISDESGADAVYREVMVPTQGVARWARLELRWTDRAHSS